MFSVSQSKVNAWRLCRLRYHYQHVDHLKPKVKARPLKFGSIVHRMQETLANGKDPFKELAAIGQHDRKLFEEEREHYGAIIEDIGYIMRAYIDYWKKNPLPPIKIAGRVAEHPFEIALTSEIMVKGRIDQMVKAKGFKWLREFKSHKSIPNDDQRWRNLQSVVYIRIIDMLGWAKLDGTLWDYIRSKPPTRPTILKNGDLSERSIDSLPSIVIDVIKQSKVKGNYQSLIDAQEANLQTWFQRVFTPVKSEVSKLLFRDFIRTAREMADYYDRSLERPVRTIGRHCGWCAYEPLCRAELQMNDVDYVIDHDFDIDKSEYQTEGEYEESE